MRDRATGVCVENAALCAGCVRRTSEQLVLGVAVIALFANSAVDRTDDGLPWEATLAGFCVFAVVFCAIYAKKTEIALSIVRCMPRRP